MRHSRLIEPPSNLPALSPSQAPDNHYLHAVEQLSYRRAATAATTSRRRDIETERDREAERRGRALIAADCVRHRRPGDARPPENRMLCFQPTCPSRGEYCSLQFSSVPSLLLLIER